MRATIVALSVLVALCAHAAAQGQVLPLPDDDQQRISKLLGAGIVGQALPSAPISDPSVYFPLSNHEDVEAFWIVHLDSSTGKVLGGSS